MLRVYDKLLVLNIPNCRDDRESEMSPLIFFLIWIIIIIVGSYISYQNREGKKRTWQIFATANNLKFVEGDIFGGSYVVGPYKGHFLKLESVQRKQGKSSRTYTQVTLTVNSATLCQKIETGEPLTVAAAKELMSSVAKSSGGFSGNFKSDAFSTRKVYYEQANIITDTRQLQRLFDQLVKLANLYGLVHLGGEVVPLLHEIAKHKRHDLRFLADQLLYEIAKDTARWKHSAAQLLCPHCLTRYGAHNVQLSWWRSITYYGCRVCGQSRNALAVAGPIIAALDNQMQTEYAHDGDALRINWLTRRQMFDFDEVEITQASDEDVERFAVQVGNDTDVARRPRYKHMRSVITNGCELSQNTQRVLQRMFGQVDIETVPA